MVCISNEQWQHHFNFLSCSGIGICQFQAGYARWVFQSPVNNNKPTTDSRIHRDFYFEVLKQARNSLRKLLTCNFDDMDSFW